MNEQEQTMMEQYQKALDSSQLNEASARLNQQQQDVYFEEKNQGVVSEQLDVDSILEMIHNLLKGYVLKKTDKGMDWVEPKNNDMRILTDYGVNYVLGAVQWYVNKNTLLSNYDDTQINTKMEDFATTLADDIFMEYDKMFLYPTLEDCKDEIQRRIQERKEKRKFAYELLGKEVDEKKEKEIQFQILKEMEKRIERELTIIREQKIKNKLKRFESIIRFVQDTVHSAYQRAWKGQERTTLRQHIHVSENKGLVPMHQRNSFNPLRIFNRGNN